MHLWFKWNRVSLCAVLIVSIDRLTRLVVSTLLPSALLIQFSPLLSSPPLPTRAVHDADISRAASLRLILPCKWKGSVLLHGDTAQDGNRTNYPRASSSSSSRSMLGDLGNLLGAGWGDSWGAKVQDPHSAAGLVGGSAMGWAWREVHLVLQGHRLVWWESEHDIDDGKACVGQLLLYGHAGTTQVGAVSRTVVTTIHLLITKSSPPHHRSLSCLLRHLRCW